MGVELSGTIVLLGERGWTFDALLRRRKKKPVHLTLIDFL